jgi:3-oxoacyl-[acyl-carrier protein] reductase/meso-butanediol dehydrogenase/(S,S)-butanediol dehydrogenase/diacetyl reductase
LAREGAAVVVSGGRRDPASFPEHEKRAGWKATASVVAQIAGEGGRAMAFDCDVADRAEVAALFAAAEECFGTPDAVVNNAGTAGGAGAAPLLDLDDELWHRTINVNLNGTYNVCKLAGLAMRTAGKPGAIVNISSLAGRMGMANYGAYCASKFGVIGLSQQLALELAGLKIRVNCLCPGSVNTDMSDGTLHRMAERNERLDFEAIKRSVVRSIPLGRQGYPEEQAATIAFLLSDEAAYITGQTINVDGGVRLD